MEDVPAAGARLRLRAEDDEDLAVISACLQDAVVAVGDIAYLPQERLLALVVNRFCWECCGADARAGAGDRRVLSGLCFEGVRAVRLRGIDRARREHLMELLAVRALPAGDGDPPGACVMEIQFSGDQALRVAADRVSARFEDLEEPYPTAWRPRHALDEAP